MHCLLIKNLKKKQNSFKREKFYFLLLIGLISLSGFMWGLKSFQLELISPNKIENSKNHDFIRSQLSNDLEGKHFQIKPNNRGISIDYHRFSIEELQSYNESSPIKIDGNSDFINQANIHNWTGDGGYLTPYIITNLNITANIDLIDIRNTNLSFQISNCLLQRGRYGIYLENASHGSVLNTIIRNNTRFGISIKTGQTYTLSKLTLLDNTYGGIFIGSSNNTSLVDINCTNNGNNGIVIFSSRNNTLSNIHISSNKGTGISVSDSENSDFSKILSRNNDGPGFYVSYSNYSSFLDITCINNSGAGLLISWSLNCDIIQSSFTNNSVDGLELEYTNETSISHCNFSNNSYNGIDLLYSHLIVLNNISILNNGYNNGYAGLKAYAVFNGSFSNITCSLNDGEGFEGVDIENSVVSNCIMINNSNSGISFYRSQNIIFLTNSIANNSFGGYSWKGGFYIEDSNNLTISHNYIYRNKGKGLELSNTNDTVITFNAIYKQDGNGITIGSISMRNLITNNIVYNNAYSAIYGDSYFESIINADKNVIVENDFIANFQAERSYQSIQYYSQADLRGPTFNVHHNYWDNINPLDEDEDGIVDNPYSLSEQMWGEEEIHLYDEYPLTEPTNQPWIHYLTTPILLYPRSMPEPDPYEVEIEWQQTRINGTIRMLWITPIDTENHEVTFSVYYSRNYGENWTEIISGIETSYYDWDTTTILDGEIILRVEAFCTHGESTMDTDQREIRVDNSPPVLTDLQASPFSPIFYIMSGLMIAPILKRLRTNKKDV